MDLRLEVVVGPVSDTDRATTFHEEAGFTLDVDTSLNPDLRVVQMTPPGSACSLSMARGSAAPDMEPGSPRGLQITTSDVRAGRPRLEP